MRITARIASWLSSISIHPDAGTLEVNRQTILPRWKHSPLYTYLHSDTKDPQVFAKAIREEIYLQTGLDFSEARILKLDLRGLESSLLYRERLTQD